MRRVKILMVLAVLTIGVIGTTAVASANDAFLCPVVGDAWCAALGPFFVLAS